MFQLTPQEKTALAAFMTVCLIGSIITWSLNRDLRPVHWIKTSSAKIKEDPPDINTATVEQLIKLPGVGPKSAVRIVDYRNNYGPFIILDDLRKVKGMSKVNIQKIKDYYQGIADANH